MSTTPAPGLAIGLLVFAILTSVLIFFALFWCFVVWLISHVGGWSRLAARYAAGARPVTGERYSGLRGRVGSANYRGILTLHLAADGFFMETMPLFALGHPRLFIPWSELSQRAPYKMLFWDAESFSVGQPAITTITLPAGLLARHRARG